MTQKARPPKPLSELKSKKGWARGGRSEFLLEELATYTEALEAGYVSEAEALRKIYLKYFTIFPWRLPLGTEPLTTESGKTWRDIDTTQPLQPEELDADEANLKRTVMKERKAVSRVVRKGNTF